MSKPTPQRGREPDPMAGVVDRLLAQLPGLQGQPEPPRPASGSRTPATAIPMQIVPQSSYDSGGQVLSMWMRVVLGLSLGVTMGWWPYPRACGVPLFSYLAAVSTVIVAGLWAGSASWRVRSGLAHTIAMVLVFYGLLMAGSELLPRTGYAVERATWACDDGGPGPSLVLSSGS
jgi:hypothetical protein